MCQLANCNKTAGTGQTISQIVSQILEPRHTRRDRTDSILLGCLVGLLILFWILYLNREFIRAKLSYLKLLLVDLCLCDDVDDDELELDCEGMEWDARRVFSRKIMGSLSPPPPYEHPPSYTVAVSNELEYLYSHVIA